MKNIIAGIIILLHSTEASAQVSWRLIQQNTIHIINNDTSYTATSGYYYDSSSSRYGLPPGNPIFRYQPEDQYPHMLLPFDQPIEYDSVSEIITVKAQPPERLRLRRQAFYPDGKISMQQLYKKHDLVNGWGLYLADSLFYTGSNLTKVKRYQPIPSAVGSQQYTWGLAGIFGYIYDSSNRLVQKFEWQGDSTPANLIKVRVLTYNSNGLLVHDSASHYVTEFYPGTGQVKRQYWTVFKDYYYKYDNAGRLAEGILLFNTPQQDSFEKVRYTYDSSGRLASDSTLMFNIQSGRYEMSLANNYYYNSNGTLHRQVRLDHNYMHTQSTLHDLHYQIDFFYNNHNLLSKTVVNIYSQYNGSSTQITEYKYCADTADCKPDIPATATTTEPEGIISVYPNPAVGFIHVEAAFTEETYVRVSISTPTGFNVLRIADNNVTKYKKQIPVDSLPPGIYLVTVETKYGRISKRIMIL